MYAGSFFYAGSTLIATNDNWAQSTNAVELGLLTTQFGITLTPGSKDALILATLPPGLYSAIISGVNGTTGVGLIDLNELP